VKVAGSATLKVMPKPRAEAGENVAVEAAVADLPLRVQAADIKMMIVGHQAHALAAAAVTKTMKMIIVHIHAAVAAEVAVAVDAVAGSEIPKAIRKLRVSADHFFYPLFPGDFLPLEILCF
jgi:hypothetical protein